MAEEAQGQPNDQETVQLPEEFQGKSTQDIYNALVAERNRSQEMQGKLSTFDRYGGPEAFADAYNTLYQRYAADNAQSQQQPARQQQTEQPQRTSQTADFSDWDLLTPQEQAARLSQNITQQVASAAQQYVQGIAQEYATQFQQAQEQQAKAMRNEWDIYRQAFEVARKNPAVDMEKLLQEMVTVATGDTQSLMTLAMKNMTAEQDIEKRIKEGVEAYRADEEQRRANEAMQVLSGNPNGPLNLTQEGDAPKTAREENALIAKRLVEDGVLTPGHFAP